MTHQVFWTVGLSDGTNLHENRGDYLRDQLRSPWERLCLFLEAHDLTITSLGLYTEDGKRWTLPSRGRLPLEEFAKKVEENDLKLTTMRVFRGKELAVHYGLKDFPAVREQYADVLSLMRAHVSEGVTGMVFFDHTGRSHYLPLHFKNPRIAAFYKGGQPTGYHFFRVRAEDAQVEGSVMKLAGSPDVYTVAEAQYADGRKLQVWVSERYTDISWSLII
jgi:hypothetical protein